MRFPLFIATTLIVFFPLSVSAVENGPGKEKRGRDSMEDLDSSKEDKTSLERKKNREEASHTTQDVGESDSSVELILALSSPKVLVLCHGRSNDPPYPASAILLDKSKEAAPDLRVDLSADFYPALERFLISTKRLTTGQSASRYFDLMDFRHCPKDIYFSTDGSPNKLFWNQVRDLLKDNGIITVFGPTEKHFAPYKSLGDFNAKLLPLIPGTLSTPPESKLELTKRLGPGK